ncbi:MAG: nitroreductase/quinone reductase family protein [Anaerolineales bacterium]|jgi:deazaflavin-dependent oxidoreductase (nitroreductase family)
MWYNPLMIWLLKSPLHGLVSKNLMLVTISGRKSGKLITTPVNYQRSGKTLWVVSWRDRKWWRNLRGGGDARVWLAAKAVEGRGQVIEEEKAVEQSLFDYYRRAPKTAKYVQIGLNAAGQPIPADCQRAAQKMVMIRIDLF